MARRSLRCWCTQAPCSCHDCTAGRVGSPGRCRRRRPEYNADRPHKSVARDRPSGILGASCSGHGCRWARFFCSVWAASSQSHLDRRPAERNQKVRSGSRSRTPGRSHIQPPWAHIGDWDYTFGSMGNRYDLGTPGERFVRSLQRPGIWGAIASRGLHRVGCQEECVP